MRSIINPNQIIIFRNIKIVPALNNFNKLINQKRNFKILNWEIKVATKQQSQYNESINFINNIVKIMSNKKLSKLETEKSKYIKFEINSKQLETTSNKIIGKYLLNDFINSIVYEPIAAI